MTTVNTLTHTVTALTDASTYQFKVIAKDAARNTSSASNVVIIKTLPVAPSNFQVNAIEYSNLIASNVFTGITLNWSSSVSVGVSYKLYYKRKESNTYNSVAIPFGNTSYFLTTAVCPMPMNYNLYIVAVKDNVESSKSNEIFFKTPPAIPTGLSASLIKETSLTLSWNLDAANQDKIIYWNVFKKKSTDATYLMVTPINILTNTCNITGLEQNSEYSFKVIATDMFGNSSETLSQQIITKKYCLPSASAVVGVPSNNASSGSFISYVLLGSDGFNKSSTYNGVFWNDYTNDSANIQSGNVNILKVTVNATDQNLNAAVVAYIDYNNDGNFTAVEKITFGNLSKKQNSINVPVTFVSDPFVINQATLNVPLRLRIIYQRNENSIEIDPCSFKGVGEVEEYTVTIISGFQRSVNNENNNELQVTTLANLNEKNLRILDSNEQSVNTFDEIILFPNPVTNDVLNISGIEDNLPYRIINILGQDVVTGKIINGTINVANLPQSTYSLEILNKDQRIVKHFIKQ